MNRYKFFRLNGLFFVLLLQSHVLLAQEKNKINLDDVKIEGEGFGMNQFFQKQGKQTDLDKHLKIKKNFREEILDEVPFEMKKRKKKVTKK